MTRWTEQDVRAITHRLGEAIKAPLVLPARNKYGAHKCVHQGEKFDSKRELQCWKDFKLQELAGDIRAVLRQVSFCLPGSIRRIRVDFLVVHNDGRQTWHDAKGVETQAWNLKAALVAQAYGIQIERI